jgi:hypothetical protein
VEVLVGAHSIRWISLVAVVLFSALAQAREIIPYHRLVLKDLEEMTQIVEKKVKEAQQASENQDVPLEEAFFSVYSRPDDDGMIEKVNGPLRNELEEQNAREKVIERLITEALEMMKKGPKEIRADVQVTYWILIDNTMGELKSTLETAGSFEEEQIKRIADAKIKLTKYMTNERALRLMKATVSPSETAKKILLDFQKKQKSKTEK